MADKNWAGLTPWVGSIDIANDLVAVWKNSNSTLYKATPNQLANLTSQWVGRTDVQTLTNKTLTSPTISGPTLSGTITGTYTLGGTPTFPAAVVTLTGAQTLTNKILTSPTINAPTITNATISADALTGFTVANNGTIYGLSVTGGKLAAGALANNSVSAANLSTSAIFLGYGSTSSTFSTASATAVQVTGVTATVTIPAGGRAVKITGWVNYTTHTATTWYNIISLWDGVVGSGTLLAQTEIGTNTANTALQLPATVFAADLVPGAGAKTYNMGLSTTAGASASLKATTGPVAFILVEVT